MDDQNKNHCYLLARREPVNADLWRLDVMKYISQSLFRHSASF